MNFEEWWQEEKCALEELPFRKHKKLVEALMYRMARSAFDFGKQVESQPLSKRLKLRACLDRGFYESEPNSIELELLVDNEVVSSESLLL